MSNFGRILHYIVPYGVAAAGCGIAYSKFKSLENENAQMRQEIEDLRNQINEQEKSAFAQNATDYIMSCVRKSHKMIMSIFDNFKDRRSSQSRANSDDEEDKEEEEENQDANVDREEEKEEEKHEEAHENNDELSESSDKEISKNDDENDNESNKNTPIVIIYSTKRVIHCDSDDESESEDEKQKKKDKKKKDKKKKDKKKKDKKKK